jgi:GH25 family lysozyme M1 (1,4-beta-N-acetylmuramidase)
MRLYALTLLAVATFVVGCGGGSSTTKKNATPPPPECHPRTPPSAGECIQQHYGITEPKGPVRLGLVGTDTSQWQGREPRTTGLRFTIIQSNYGTHVEPSVASQIRNAKRNHIPFGCYTFMEPGVSGRAEAEVANRVCSVKAGRQLGLWTDVEVNGTYQHACEYISEAFRLKAHIAGKYSSPGLDRSGHCAGYLWPAEWGTIHPYTFSGYPTSAIKIHQYCGTCRRYGVEIDMDQSLGLLALAKPHHRKGRK